MKVFASYKGLFGSLRRYWSDYGGWSDFLSSPLLHLSVLITATSHRYWLNEDWTELPLSLLPNLLGFSLGSYALIFSLANEKLMAALSSPTKGKSPTLLRMINATFLHFILMQTVAIIFALAQKGTAITDAVALTPLSYNDKANLQTALVNIASATGYWLTVYSVVLLIGAAIAAYRLAIMSGKAATFPASNSGQADG